MLQDKHLWMVLRIALAVLIAIHGWARLTLGTSPLFGEWLNAQGFSPLGPAIAWFITGFEITASLALIANRFVAVICAVFAVIYIMGIVLVHAPEGWFVVGHGRNGSEYSVLLVVCLLLIGTRDYLSKKAKSVSD